MSDNLPSFLSDPKVLAGLEALCSTATKSATARNGPYYTEKYAIFARDILERLHADRAPLKITCTGSSIHTIRLHYYQGVTYLVDKLDPTGRFKELKSATRCMISDDYLLFSIRPNKKVSAATLMAIPPEKWKFDVDEFLDTATHGDKFLREGLLLSSSELLWIESRLIGVQELFNNLSTENRILIIMFDQSKLTTQTNENS